LGFSKAFNQKIFFPFFQGKGRVGFPRVHFPPGGQTPILIPLGGSFIGFYFGRGKYGGLPKGQGGGNSFGAFFPKGWFGTLVPNQGKEMALKKFKGVGP